MTDTSDWAFPVTLQPKATDLPFDLQAALNSVVQLHSQVPQDAFTATALGTERSGNGVVIMAQQRPVVLTIGYLIAEAENIVLRTFDGRELIGHGLAYDPVTGFGLVLPLGELNTPALRLGNSRRLSTGSALIVIGHGGIEHAVVGNLIARREFAGYWEYLLDDALFVAPPHPQWGGTALLDERGALVGLGSLLLQEHVTGDQFDANLFVPIDLLMPILDEMLTTGAVKRTPRPWLGLYAIENDSQIVIAGVTQPGPAQRAELRRGDVISRVGKHPVNSLAEFYRTLWAQGPAGSMISLTVRRGKRRREFHLRSASRDDYLLKERAH